MTFISTKKTAISSGILLPIFDSHSIDASTNNTFQSGFENLLKREISDGSPLQIPSTEIPISSPSVTEEKTSDIPQTNSSEIQKPCKSEDITSHAQKPNEPNQKNFVSEKESDLPSPTAYLQTNEKKSHETSKEFVKTKGVVVQKESHQEKAKNLSTEISSELFSFIQAMLSGHSLQKQELQSSKKISNENQQLHVLNQKKPNKIHTDHLSNQKQLIQHDQVSKAEISRPNQENKKIETHHPFVEPLKNHPSSLTDSHTVKEIRIHQEKDLSSIAQHIVQENSVTAEKSDKKTNTVKENITQQFSTQDQMQNQKIVSEPMTNEQRKEQNSSTSQQKDLPFHQNTQKKHDSSLPTQSAEKPETFSPLRNNITPISQNIKTSEFSVEPKKKPENIINMQRLDQGLLQQSLPEKTMLNGQEKPSESMASYKTQIIEKIIDTLKNMPATKTHQTQFTLDTPSASIKVNVSVNNDVVSVKIISDNEQVVKELQNSSNQLRELLGQENLQSGDFEFGHSKNSQEQDHQSKQTETQFSSNIKKENQTKPTPIISKTDFTQSSQSSSIGVGTLHIIT